MGYSAARLKALALAALLLTGVSAQETWNPRTLLAPAQIAKQVRDPSPDKPLILFVGFAVMYRAAHIPAALLAGPASTAPGLAQLKGIASGIPRNRRLILYCGCCPFAKCPNVKPAYKILRQMGFSQIQILELDQNFHTDWVEKGYPVIKHSD